MPPLTGELPDDQQLVWKFCTILNWRESLYKIAEFRDPISSHWLNTQNDVSESLLFVTRSGSNAWTAVGAGLMRQTLSLSRAGEQEIKWKASSVGWYTCVIVAVKLKCVAPVWAYSVHSTFADSILKAALQKRGSIEPIEPPLDPPLPILDWFATTHKSVNFWLIHVLPFSPSDDSLTLGSWKRPFGSIKTPCWPRTQCQHSRSKWSKIHAFVWL